MFLTRFIFPLNEMFCINSDMEIKGILPETNIMCVSTHHYIGQKPIARRSLMVYKFSLI